jgi:hypothetical protein
MIENIQPPIAKIIPTELEKSGTLELIIILVKGSRKPEVIDYLHKK